MTDEITIAIRLNGELTRLTGRARLSLQVPVESDVHQLIEKLGAEYPQMAERLALAVPVVDGRHATKDQVLTADQEVALLMPVAGGWT